MAPSSADREVSHEVRTRLDTINDIVNKLVEAKRKQDVIAPSAGAGVWITFQLWKRMLRQLQTQMAEILEWEHLLLVSQQELGVVQSTMESLEVALADCQAQSQSKVSQMAERIQQLEGELARKEAVWDRTRMEMGAQAGELLDDLNKRTHVLRDNQQLADRIKTVDAARQRAEAAAVDANNMAAELTKRLGIAEIKCDDAQRDRDVLTKEVRELSMQLASSREQGETYRQLLAVKRQPSDQMVDENRRLADDNRRLVALLGATKEWKDMADRMASREGDLRYIPMHEVLAVKGGISGVYPALEDRPKSSKHKRHADAEDWNWVPQEAIDAVMEACARVVPNAPAEPLFSMLLVVNKIWRRREAANLAAVKAKYEAELREVHHLYRQRAPYEAVVGRTRLSDLKRQLRLQAMHAEHLADKAVADEKSAADDNKVLLALGLESVSQLSKEVGRLNQKTDKLRKRLATKSRQPPVCPSCIDNMILQASPQPPTYLSEPVNQATLAPRPRTLAPATAPAAPAPHQYRAPAPNPNPTSYPHQHTVAGTQHRTEPSKQFTFQPGSIPNSPGSTIALDDRPAQQPVGASAWMTSAPLPQSPGQGENRANRLASLIQEYEKPVMQYSRWDEQGRFQRSGRVPATALGSAGQLQAL